MKLKDKAIEALAVVLGSCAAGFIIGTLQHFVGFGAWGYGFEEEAFKLAIFEGGLVGLIAAIPTGAIAYYWILRSSVTVREVAIICGASLVGGCILGITFAVLSACITPLMTIGTAFWVRRLDQARATNEPSSTRS